MLNVFFSNGTALNKDRSYGTIWYASHKGRIVGSVLSEYKGERVKGYNAVVHDHETNAEKHFSVVEHGTPRAARGAAFSWLAERVGDA